MHTDQAGGLGQAEMQCAHAKCGGVLKIRRKNKKLIYLINNDDIDSTSK